MADRDAKETQDFDRRLAGVPAGARTDNAEVYFDPFAPEDAEAFLRENDASPLIDSDAAIESDATVVLPQDDAVYDEMTPHRELEDTMDRPMPALDKTVVASVPPIRTRHIAHEERVAQARAGRTGREERDPYADGRPAPYSVDESFGKEGASTCSARPSRRGASPLRRAVRLVALAMLVFGMLTISGLTEQTVDQTSLLSSEAEGIAQEQALQVLTGTGHTFEEDPIKWAGERVLLISTKFIAHGLSIRQQAHVVEFALMGGVVALNVLAWMSGWAHRRSAYGHIRTWRTLLMFVLSIGLCAAASFADQYHKLFVPGRHFDSLDLVLDASGYVSAVVAVFLVWSVGSALYRFVLRK